MSQIPAPDYDPFDSKVQVHPYDKYAQLRTQCPVYHNPERNLWFVSRFEDVEQVAKNWRTFSSEPTVSFSSDGKRPYEGPGKFIITDPPEHTAIRKIFAPHFANARMKELAPQISSQAHELIGAIIEKGGGDLVQEFAFPLTIGTIMTLLGLPLSDRTYVKQQTSALMQEYAANSSKRTESSIAAAFALLDYIDDYCSSNTTKQGLIAETARAGLLPKTQLKNATLLLLEAGSTTTASLLGNTLHILGRDHATRNFLIEDRDRLRPAIEEFLRYESPVQSLGRTTKTETRLGDSVLPQGSKVVLLFGAANRDDLQFADADRLILERRRSRHLAFGAGVHTCIGAPLARIEAEVGLRAVLDLMPDYKLTGQEERVLQPHDRGFLHLHAVV